MAKKIFIIAGEASGDLHGANLIHELRAMQPDVIIYGIGGDLMREAGALEFFDLAHFHVTGLTEVIKKIPQYKKAARDIMEKLNRVRPDAVILIDNPGFNLHLAEKIHAINIPIIYYISPQLWAWAPKRIYKMKKWIKKVLVVFDFEKKVYEDHQIPVAFVGHPLRDKIEKKPHDAALRKELLGDKKYLVSLLPGSRKGELKELFKIFLGAASILSKENDTQFILIKSRTLPISFYKQFMDKLPFRVHIIEKDSYEAIRASDLAIACSGTATLECALLGTPMIIANKASFLTYVLVKNLIRVPFIGLPNLILNSPRFPEFLQYDAKPEKIASSARQILTDHKLRDTMKKDLDKIGEKLGGRGANRRAAMEVLKTI